MKYSKQVWVLFVNKLFNTGRKVRRNKSCTSRKFFASLKCHRQMIGCFAILPLIYTWTSVLRLLYIAMFDVVYRGKRPGRRPGRRDDIPAPRRGLPAPPPYPFTRPPPPYLPPRYPSRYPPRRRPPRGQPRRPPGLPTGPPRQPLQPRFPPRYPPRPSFGGVPRRPFRQSFAPGRF